MPLSTYINKTNKDLFFQYIESKEVFKKTYYTILLKFWPYNCAIELQVKLQPSFLSIYNIIHKNDNIMQRHW